MRLPAFPPPRAHRRRARLLAFALAGCGGDDVTASAPQTQAQAPAGTTATLALLETTDLHTNVLSYDYFKLAEDKSLGFERVSTLIAQARAQYPNTLLLDNGDTIQGTALADYQALVKPLGCDQTLAIYKVMNAASFDGGGIGNHEFNYGLPYLSQVTGNTFNVDGLPAPRSRRSARGRTSRRCWPTSTAQDQRAAVQPYTILTRTVTATRPTARRSPRRSRSASSASRRPRS
jgi:2',3'-cyclic-nucleotide 2'-phosphodiesterase/3'-nucleotidase